MEYGNPHSITTSRGFVRFNHWTSDGGMGLGLGSGNGYQLQMIRGAVYPHIRNPLSNRPQKDGGIVHPFWKGAKLIEFEGLIFASSNANRTELVDHLSGSLDVLLYEEGTWAWTPAGAAERTHTVRLFEPVQVLPGGSTQGGATAADKTFEFTLIAAEMHDEDDY